MFSCKMGLLKKQWISFIWTVDTFTFPSETRIFIVCKGKGKVRTCIAPCMVGDVAQWQECRSAGELSLLHARSSADG